MTAAIVFPALFIFYAGMVYLSGKTVKNKYNARNKIHP